MRGVPIGSGAPSGSRHLQFKTTGLIAWLYSASHQVCARPSHTSMLAKGSSRHPSISPDHDCDGPRYLFSSCSACDQH